MNFTRLIPQGQGRSLVQSGGDRPLEPLELKAAYQSILLESSRSNVGTKGHGPLMQLIDPRLGQSGRFWEGLVIDYQGFLLASSRSRIRLGKVNGQNLETIFLNHPLLRKIRLGKVEGCGKCPHFRRCGGDRNAAYGFSGNYLGKDPGCWLGVESA